MPSLLVIRLLPEEPVPQDRFRTDYLSTLTIRAFELSFTKPGVGDLLGTAVYLEPDLKSVPGKEDPAPKPNLKTGITQHFKVEPAWPDKSATLQMFSVATAVIAIPPPPGGHEHDTADIRLEIERHGTIVHRQAYFNVPVSSYSGQAPDPNDFPKRLPVSLYLKLPAPAGAAGMGFTLPEDGSMPAYTSLKQAVEDVLGDDPGNTAKIRELSLEESRHVAREIAWNRMANPLPTPSRTLETLYTGPYPAGSDQERERQIFEGDLLMHYTMLNTTADRLTELVYALSAAMWCEDRSAAALSAGFIIPVIPSHPDRHRRVVLTGVGGAAMAPSPGVPAAYFYALTAALPHQIDRGQRYDMAVLDGESQTVKALSQAIDDGVITEDTQVNPYQAARRLESLGRLTESGSLTCELSSKPAPVNGLYTAWLDFHDADIATFWKNLDATQKSGHLHLIVCAVSGGHAPLIAAIESHAFRVATIGNLVAKTNQEWIELFHDRPDLLPDFTLPGTTDERADAFIRNLRRFFDVAEEAIPGPSGSAIGPPLIDRSPGNLVDALIAAVPGFDFAAFTDAEVVAAAATLIPHDEQARADFLAWLHCIGGVVRFAKSVPSKLQFSVIEALWARGFVSSVDFEGLDLDKFRQQLRGSIAYDHAQEIWDVARSNGSPASAPSLGPFAPVNPDGRLTDCVPPEHLSPLGPVAYLKDLLRVSAASTCEAPFADEAEPTLGELVTERRGPLGDLLATPANLSTTLPVIDLVNESLEQMVATGVNSGAVYDTAAEVLAGHVLDTARPTPADTFAHPAGTVFEALPEHSTPATPTAKPGAWDKLRTDFSSCRLPYDQPLDVARTYLEAMGTSRYATMRRLRRHITELCLDPTSQPSDFQSHLYRYPVTTELAVEYVGLTPVEYQTLFSPGGVGPASLPRHFGFDGEDTWVDQVRELTTFLERTCLSFCEFRELQASGYVAFEVVHPEGLPLPECEPCCLDDFTIEFTAPKDPVAALKRLNAFIRLWRRLNSAPDPDSTAPHEGATGTNAPEPVLTMAALADIATVVPMFNESSTANSAFIPQLAALLLLIDDYGVDLDDGSPREPDATGTDRTHLLSLWVPAASHRQWAVDHLLERIQRYALYTYGCEPRPPEVLRLLADNLEPLSRLAGFDPGNPQDTWDARPTHTLRMVEILAKIYASDFEVGDLLFLFTADPQIQGGDPFPLPTRNEALDDPFSTPDDEPDSSLMALRRALLDVTVTPEEARAWTFSAMGERLHADLGMELPPVSDRWNGFGRHLFPHVLQAEGIDVDAGLTRYATPLTVTSTAMWNTPAGGPFHHDAGTGTLWSELPLDPARVTAKLARIRQLNEAERDAVSDLYHQPRAELASFSFLFDDFSRAERDLLEQPDAEVRWARFQDYFALFMARARVVARHLAAHVDRVAGTTRDDGAAVAALVLRELHADENQAVGPWETDAGAAPELTWGPRPNGSAMAALLGLVGTGLIAEFRDDAGAVRWRETTSDTCAFGPAEDACSSPVPTVIPALGSPSSPLLNRFAAVRNGFAMANDDGRPLGGVEGFEVRWAGLVLIDKGGAYGFRVGVPGTPGSDDEHLDIGPISHTHRWRVTLDQGQRSWVLLAHDWPGEEAPAAHSAPARLEAGFYRISITLKRRPTAFNGPNDVAALRTGFQLHYQGPDTDGASLPIPTSHLFVPSKDHRLGAGVNHAPRALTAALDARYVPTVRDIRRTYQRAFKALLFAHRLSLGAAPLADDGQSELGFLFGHPEAFAGRAYRRVGGTFVTHQAWFDPDLWPVLDPYDPPVADQRATPSPHRSAALFDWWERLFDYTVMRAAVGRSPERPAWLLFHEAAELHEDNPAHLLRHLNVDLSHTGSVLHFFDSAVAASSYDVTSDDLTDDRWAVRVWHADRWVRGREREFRSENPADAEVYRWASDGPDPRGAADITRFYRRGCIEQGEPRRYREIRTLDDALRLRGREALVAYLTGHNRVPLPWGGYASNAAQLSELLLIDVETGLCQKSSRIEEAISALQLYVARARLGLEPRLAVGTAFTSAWDRRFRDFHSWQAATKRDLYRENWIEWETQEEDRRSEAFRFLASELRRNDLTLPVPGGLPSWPNPALEPYGPLTLLQEREPSDMRLLLRPPEGLGLLGTPGRHGRPSWLSPVVGPVSLGSGDQGEEGEEQEENEEHEENEEEEGEEQGEQEEREEEEEGERPDPRRNQGPIAALIAESPVDYVVPEARAVRQNGSGDAPLVYEPDPSDDVVGMWFEAPVRLGTRFLRIAAASTPEATARYQPGCGRRRPSYTCQDCSQAHGPTVDEYYFWLEESDGYEAIEQVAEWGAVPGDPVAGTRGDPLSDWHRPDRLPHLLDWPSRRVAHLRWGRLHRGELLPPRRSVEAVLLREGAEPTLVFTGRIGDSLVFEVTGAELPRGHPEEPRPGFRYDIAVDQAIPLPELVPAPAPRSVGGLTAFPYFAWAEPGAPILPADTYATALTIATHLATHCHYEEALAWLEVAYEPLKADNAWSCCARHTETQDDNAEDGPGEDARGEVIRSASVRENNSLGDKNQRREEEGAEYEREQHRCCCSGKPADDSEARRRAVVLLYVDIMTRWTDSMLSAGTPEAFRQARLLSDTAARVLGPAPRTVVIDGGPTASPAPSVSEVDLACPPLNPRLVCAYRHVADRLGLIRACLDVNRQPTGACGPVPFFGGGARTRDCWRSEGHLCLNQGCHCRSASPYRFEVLAQRAQELAGELRSLGAQLMSAYERGDAEYLAQMRVRHERQLNDLTLAVRQSQWRDADWQVQALQKAKAAALTNLQWYRRLITVGLLPGEAEYEPLTVTSTALRTAGNVVEAIGQFMNMVPDPNVGFPCNFVTLPPGKKLAMIFASSGTIVRTAADIVSTVAGLGLTKDGWERREDEWQHQVDVLTIQVAEIERQILGAERRRDGALRELNDHQQTMDNAAEVHDFLRDKLTDHATYLWLQKETAALHYRMYELAMHCALQAEHAFNVELGHRADRFVPTDAWDNLHEGLLSGERLGVAVQQMRKAFQDHNRREYELTKHISLRQSFPAAFLQLRATGTAQIELPEWIFDLDHPGHYMRRIKSVSVSIPAVVGPYTGVNAKLTLLASSTRVSPELRPPVHGCCDHDACSNGYRLEPDDRRAINVHTATDAIATSSGQADSGLFRLDFGDPRYLPFELAGAASCWRIDLPPENNQFDLEQLSDVVMHLSYTAREGGELLRSAASACTRQRLTGDGVRFIDATRDLAGRWRTVETDRGDARLLELHLERAMFPYLTGDRRPVPRRIEVLFEAAGAHPSRHHTLLLHRGQRLASFDSTPSAPGVTAATCVGDAAWPGFYHGIIDLNTDGDSAERDCFSPSHDDPLRLGVLSFPSEVRHFDNVYLLVHFDGTKDVGLRVRHHDSSSHGEHSGRNAAQRRRRVLYERLLKTKG